MAGSGRRSDFVSYHESVTNEIHSLKDRIRNFVRHWPTDGEFKEAVLRSILRRHVPETVAVGRGFIVTPEEVSTQIDLLIVDRNAATLFKDGDLMIVTPDAVRAIVEVKTRAERPELRCALSKLAGKGCLCSRVSGKETWTGLFVYEGAGGIDEGALKSLGQAHSETGHAVDCVCIGKDTLIRYWPHWEAHGLPNRPSPGQNFWRSYELKNLAPAYFVGNLTEAVSPQHALPSSIPGSRARSLAWYPLLEGKENHARWQLILGEPDPHRVDR